MALRAFQVDGQWPTSAKVLALSDDRDLAAFLVVVLEQAGFASTQSGDLASALKHAQHNAFDLAVLDLDPGSANWRTVLKELRRASVAPIMVLSDSTSEDDKIEAFEIGADDYVTKPLNHRELLARLRARRRALQMASRPRPTSTELRAGPLTLNVSEHLVSAYGRPVNLTATEFRVLEYLMLNAGHLVQTIELARHVWGWASPQASNLQRVTICRLRRKLEVDTTCPQLLRTIPGIGVVLDASGCTERVQEVD